MNTEAYILTKLSNLSEEDELLAQEIEKRLGPWSTPLDVSKYFKRHIIHLSGYLIVLLSFPVRINI